MAFTLAFYTNSSAFRDEVAHPDERELHERAKRQQVALILRDAAKHIEAGDNRRDLIDSDGNRVGSFELT